MFTAEPSASVASDSRRLRAPPVAAYLASFVLLGLAASVAGPLLSHLRTEVGTDDAGIGLVLAAQSLGYVGGSLLSGPVVDRGRGHAMWSAALLVATACFGALAAASSTGSLALVLAVFVVLGVALGCCDVAGNTLVVWSRPGRSDPALHGLHLCFAVGALASPLVANRALSWTSSVWPITVPVGVLAVVVVARLRSSAAPVRTRVGWVTPGRAQGHAPARPEAQWRHILVICGFFAVYVGVEAAFAGWIHSYVEQIGYGGAGTATGITAIFWTGFVIGRVLAIWLSRKIAAGWMLMAAMSAMLVTTAVLVGFGGPGLTLWFVTFAFGLTIAPQFASMISFAEERLALTGRSTSAFIAGSGVGGIVLPWLTGVLIDAYGTGSLPWVVLAGAIVVTSVAIVVGRMLPAAVSSRTSAATCGELREDDPRSSAASGSSGVGSANGFGQ